MTYISREKKRKERANVDELSVGMKMIYCDHL